MTLKYPMVRFQSRRCRIYRLPSCKTVRHPVKSVWDTTLKYPMVRIHSRRFRIQRLHICKEVRYLAPKSVLHMTLEYSMVRLQSRRKYTLQSFWHPKECPGYNTKYSRIEAQLLECWGMWRTHSLLLLPGQPWQWVVVLHRAISMG